MSPIPRKSAIVATLVAVLGVTISLAVLTIPIPPGPPGSEFINGTSYTSESESLFGNGSWLNYSYRGVTFGFHLWCLITPGGGEICGNATESTGGSYSYSFWDGPPQVNPAWQTWIAPDSHEAVQYKQGGMVHLLVAA